MKNQKTYKYIPYRPDLKERARKLRRYLAGPERILWHELLSHKRLGVKFMRQKPLLDYIVDFYCGKLKLIIEVDGDTHCGKKNIKYDKNRDKRLKEWGLMIIRYPSPQIYESLESVYKDLKNIIQKRKMELLLRSQSNRIVFEKNYRRN